MSENISLNPGYAYFSYWTKYTRIKKYYGSVADDDNKYLNVLRQCFDDAGEAESYATKVIMRWYRIFGANP